MLKKIGMKGSGLNELLHELKTGLKNIFNEKLKKIIIYGSYARGESDEGSDVIREGINIYD